MITNKNTNKNNKNTLTVELCKGTVYTNKQRKVLDALQNFYCNNKYAAGVVLYAYDLFNDFIDDFNYCIENNIRKNELPAMLDLLNGANDWKEYAYGGCGAALIYNYDIAARLLTNSQLKRYKNGDLIPRGASTWCDIQYIALYKAALLLLNICKTC